jgi:hypothetical protein
VRTAEDLEKETIRKREEFQLRSLAGVDDPRAREVLEEQREELEAVGIQVPDLSSQRFPSRAVLEAHRKKYPLERMREIEELQKQRGLRGPEEATAAAGFGRFAIAVAVYRSEEQASAKLQELLDAGYDASIVATSIGGEISYEIRIGPYATREEAERAAAFLRENYGVSPEVFVLTDENP